MAKPIEFPNLKLAKSKHIQNDLKALVARDNYQFDKENQLAIIRIGRTKDIVKRLNTYNSEGITKKERDPKTKSIVSYYNFEPRGIMLYAEAKNMYKTEKELLNSYNAGYGRILPYRLPELNSTSAAIKDTGDEGFVYVICGYYLADQYNKSGERVPNVVSKDSKLKYDHHLKGGSALAKLGPRLDYGLINLNDLEEEYCDEFVNSLLE